MKLCAKKITSVILILTMMCMCFTACANEDASSDSSSIESISYSSNVEIVDESANNTNNSDNDDSTIESSDDVNSDESLLDESSTDGAQDESSIDDDGHQHLFKTTNTVDATCTEGGYIIMTCECGISVNEPISSRLEHQESDWIVTKEATVTSPGVEQKTCTRCKILISERAIPQITTESSEPADCNHYDYATATTTAPTCTTKGYTTVSCSCGKTQKTNEVPALGHKEGDWVIVKEATTSATGLKQKTCTRCKVVVKEETIPKIVISDDPFDIIPEKYNVHPKGNQKLVEEAIEYYLNLYREKDGVAKATRLPNKTYEYATRRAVQLSTNFDHDYDDIFEVCNELKFGQYNPPAPEKIINWDTGEITYTGNMTPEYYFGGFSEACSGPVTNRQTVDNVARAVAYGIYNSSNHWSYVGASTTKYITVGAFDQYDNGGKWWVCIATGDTNSKKYDAWNYDDKEYYQE